WECEVCAPPPLPPLPYLQVVLMKTVVTNIPIFNPSRIWMIFHFINRNVATMDLCSHLSSEMRSIIGDDDHNTCCYFVVWIELSVIEHVSSIIPIIVGCPKEFVEVILYS